MPYKTDVTRNVTFDFKKIAIFRALQLGDMLCIIPTVRAIRGAFPLATISLIGLAWQRTLVERFPEYFDEFIEFAGWPGLPECNWEAHSALGFVCKMQQWKFDLVLQMQGNGILTNSMCLLWNGRLTAGLRKSSEPAPGQGIFVISDDDQDHEILRFQKLLAPLEIATDGTWLEFKITAEEVVEFHRVSRQLSIDENKYVCIHPGARDHKRRWPTLNFSRVAEALHNEGYKIVITGSTQETEIMDQLQRETQVPTIHSIRECGNIGLGLLAAILKHSALLVSNDTGVSHIAAALNVPSVIIFSKYSSQQRWAPLDRNRHRAVSHAEADNVTGVIHCCLSQLVLSEQAFSQ
jgi:ADP-heptose:LPS heptosyltransferase